MRTSKAAARCFILVCALALPVHAATIVVNNTKENGAGSLRQALVSASDGDTIDATGVSGAITLTTGELLVNKSVTINGPGAGSLSVDGNAASRVFEITSGHTVAISDLTIRNGNALGTDGGGILNDATLTLTNCTVSGNTARFGGGAFNSGTLAIGNSTVSGNTAIDGDSLPGEGAGTYNADASTLTITNSTFSGNVSADFGGASFNTGTLQISHSTLSGNSSSFLGGGVVNLGTMLIGNTVLNTGDSGVNIYNNGGGTVTSLGYNLSSDDAGGLLTGPGDQLFISPLLGPLQNNGGPTFTHALLPGSPAIDKGDPAFVPPPFSDQRGSGFDRVVNGRIDIGSFEFQTETVAINLSASGRKVGGVNTVRLTWNGATSNSIDVQRDGMLVTTIPNSGTYTDSTGQSGRGRFTYTVCEAGTSTCSNQARVTFRQ